MIKLNCIQKSKIFLKDLLDELKSDSNFEMYEELVDSAKITDLKTTSTFQPTVEFFIYSTNSIVGRIKSNNLLFEIKSIPNSIELIIDFVSLPETLENDIYSQQEFSNLITEKRHVIQHINMFTAKLEAMLSQQELFLGLIVFSDKNNKTEKIDNIKNKYSLMEYDKYKFKNRKYFYLPKTIEECLELFNDLKELNLIYTTLNKNVISDVEKSIEVRKEIEESISRIERLQKEERFESLFD